MQRNIAIVQGHPDPSKERFGRALQAAYEEGARNGGHEVRVIDVATLDFPMLHTKDDWERGAPPPAIREAQATLRWADHIVFFYPLWAGSMPALLKGFIEQAFRPGFAMDPAGGLLAARPLRGRSARIVVTMGMPAFVYRWFFRAHSLKSLQRNILGFCGIAPIKVSLVGRVDEPDASARKHWLGKMREFGAASDAGYL
jgi:putative NADPH-quinone reductase